MMETITTKKKAFDGMLEALGITPEKALSYLIPEPEDPPPPLSYVYRFNMRGTGETQELAMETFHSGLRTSITGIRVAGFGEDFVLGLKLLFRKPYGEAEAWARGLGGEITSRRQNLLLYERMDAINPMLDPLGADRLVGLNWCKDICPYDKGKAPYFNFDNGDVAASPKSSETLLARAAFPFKGKGDKI